MTWKVRWRRADEDPRQPGWAEAAASMTRLDWQAPVSRLCWLAMVCGHLCPCGSAGYEKSMTSGLSKKRLMSVFTAISPDPTHDAVW